MNKKEFAKTVLSLKCPQCKEHSIAKGITEIYKECPNCHYVLKQVAEGWAGPALFGYTVSVIMVLLGLGIGFALYGFQYIEYFAIAGVLAAVVINIFIYRYSHSLWVNLMYVTKFTNEKDEA